MKYERDCGGNERVKRGAAGNVALAVAAALAVFAATSAAQQGGGSADTARKAPFSGAGVSASQFSAEQDSAFARARRVNASGAARFQYDVALTDSSWQAERRWLQSMPEAIIERNLAATPEELAPTGQDVIRHQQQYAPGAPKNFIPNISMAGITIPFSMGRLLGYEKDVSPTMICDVRGERRVRVTVFTLRGDTVAVVFNGVQPPGAHTFRWDGRDRRGSPAPAGDYIMEIVVGDTWRILKHVVV